MSLKLSIYLLLALSCGLALAEEEAEMADSVEDQTVYVPAEFFNDASNSAEEEASEEMEATDIGTQRQQEGVVSPYQFAVAEGYFPQAVFAAAPNPNPNPHPGHGHGPGPRPGPAPGHGHGHGPSPGHGYPGHGHYPPYPYYPYGYPLPYPFPFPYYGYPYYGYPHRPDHGHHPRPTPKPTPKPVPNPDRPKICKYVFPIGKICTYTDDI